MKDSRGRLIYTEAGGERAYEEWPVERGDVWKVGDDHLIYCADLETGAGDRLLQQIVPEHLPDAQITCVYTDPPWGASLATGFRTKAAVDGPDGGRSVDFDAFLRTLLTLCRDANPRGDTWLEMGNRENPRIVDITRQLGGTAHLEIPITYYDKHPCTLNLLRFDDQPPPGADAVLTLRGMDDADTPAPAILASTQPGDLVIDPCNGTGLTSQTAALHGRKFAGTELGERRTAIALWKLRDALQAQPIKVGAL